jgi:hypothetical protein
MASKPKRQFAGHAADTRDKLCASFTERNELDSKPCTFEQGREALGASALRAWRVDCIEPDEILSQFD